MRPEPFPARAVPIADMAPELSVRITSMIILEFEQRFGRERLEELFRHEGFGVTLEDLKDPTNFVSLRFVERLTQLLLDASGDPLFVVRAGMRVASREALGFMYYALKAFGSPGQVYARLVDLLPTVNRIGRFATVEQSRGAVTITYTSNVPETNRNFCDGRMAQFASVPTLWGLEPARVIETECVHDGARCCRYNITFREPARAWRRWSLGFLGFAVGLTMGLTGSGVGVALTGAAGIICFLVGVCLDLKAALQRKEELLANQDKALLGSMRDLEKRYAELRQVKLELEQRVQARTDELTRSNAKLTEALEKQHDLDRAKTRFFTNISHELRTPLTLILAPIETILQRRTLAEADRVELAMVHRNALRLLSHINGLLDLSRLDAQQERLRLVKTDVPLQLKGLLDSCRGLANKRGINLRFVVQDEVPRFFVDPKKIEQIFLNLMSNALRFAAQTCQGKPWVEARCGLVSGRFFFAVEDNGPGIPPATLPNIFDRFQMADSPVTAVHGGTGIGLALVKELGELHSGKVSVTSVVDEGSTFTVELPTEVEVYQDATIDRRQSVVPVAIDRRKPDQMRRLAELVCDPASLALAHLSSTTAPALVSTQAAKPLILAVDDNRDMLTYLSMLLAADYRLATAEDGDQAFRLAVQHQPDLVLADVMMPRRGGRLLLRDLRREPKTAHTPVILITAQTELEAKLSGLQDGADDYIGKPFHFEELKARIKALLKRSRLEAELAKKNDYLTQVNFDLMLAKKEVFFQTIQALALAVEAKDPYTHGHSRRVSMLADMLCQELDLTDLERERVQIAAVLHDVGKIGIPEQILNKPSGLDVRERRALEMHPLIGQRILETVGELDAVGRIILFHHERFDGGGYPHHATGADIPLGARIIAVADAYDAMTSHRSYRKEQSHIYALDEIQRCAGLQFDPQVAQAFQGLWGGRPPDFPEIPYALRDLEVPNPLQLELGW